VNAKRFRSGFAAAIVAGFLATAASAQPLNAEASGADRSADPSLPLGDADTEDTPATDPSAAPAPRAISGGKQAYGIEWADHVSPSFRRWVNGDDSPAPSVPAADPAVRNRPDALQRGSDLSTVENALDKSSADEPRRGGAGASTLFLKRVSRAHARSIVGPEGVLMGAELADGISLTPLSRSRSRGTAFDRQLPETGAAPKLASGPLPGTGPLQEIPAEERYDATPLLGGEAPAEPRGDDDSYVVAVAKGELVGVELGDQVSVVHVSQFAKAERPASGQLLVYPRSRHRPFGPINSFEHLNPFAPINVEPLQSAEDPSDPSPVARSAYAIGNWDTPGYVNLPLSDNSLYEFRARLIADQRDPRNCCGPTRITVMHDPLALVILPSMLNSMPGQTFAIVPLAPGMRAW
jgi:hypothetical protein